MTVSLETQRDRVFQALSDTTRREMLSRIARENLTVTELSEPFRISAPAISKHLKVLERAELIERIKDGKMRRFKLNTKPLRDAREVVDQLAIFWSQRLDNLDAFLKQQTKEEKRK